MASILSCYGAIDIIGQVLLKMSEVTISLEDLQAT